MNAVLYVCHGSRIVSGNKQARDFARWCSTEIQSPIQEYAYLELAEPTIQSSLEKCVDLGATSITIMPLLLLTAAHTKRDIPEATAGFQLKYPNVPVTFASPIGVHEKMVDILEERVKVRIGSTEGKITILLVGRGSSDPDVKRDLNTIGKMLQDRNENYEVLDCYLTGSTPNVYSLLGTLEGLNKKVVILPYLLFTGTLMKELASKIKKLNEENGQYILCNFIGLHPKIKEIVVEKIKAI